MIGRVNHYIRVMGDINEVAKGYAAVMMRGFFRHL
jgi:hypothetical protein